MKLIEKVKATLTSDLYRNIFTNSSWIISSNVISKFIQLIATIFITAYMGKDEYGQFGIIKSTILMFAMFAGLELGMTSTKYISQYKDRDKGKVERVVGLSNLFAIVVSLLVASLVYLFSREIAIQINAPHLYSEIQLSAFILFFSSLNGIQGGILSGLENFKTLSINNASSTIISSVCLVVAAKYFGLKGVVIAFGFNYVILFSMNYVSLKKLFYSKFKINIFDRANFKELEVLRKFSLPAILSGLMVGPVIWFCNYLLVNQTGGYEHMANFDIANQWRNTILFIPAALSQIALPLLASNVHDSNEYNKIYKINLKLNLIISSIMVVVLVSVSPLIVKLYGDRYSDALIPIIVMFITTGFIAVNNVVGRALASLSRMWLGFCFNIIWAIVLIVFCYLFVVNLNLGAIGISFAFLISYIVHTFVQFYSVRKLLK